MDIVTLGAALNGSAEYVNSHFKGGSNIQIVDNPDGTQTINASGEVSSEDTVARADIAAIKDGETLDSFGDVETALATKANAATTYTKTEVDTALDNKVDKVSGKGLSTNDYTTAEKTKLAGIAEGAEVNEIEGIKVNSSTVNPDVNKVVNITVPTTAADVSALPDTTKYAVALSLTINSSTFVMTGQLKDQNGDNLGTAQTIDLPLESVVVGGSYNSQTKKVVLTLQNGNTIEFSVADLVSGLQTELSVSNKLNPAYIDYDSTHRAVSDTEKSTWNGKQNAIDSSHKLSADLVDDTSTTNKFATETELEQIETNKNNILLLNQYGGGFNKLRNTAASTGIFTVNEDGSVTISGSTGSSHAVLQIGTFTGYANQWYLGGISGGSSTTYYIDVLDGVHQKQAHSGYVLIPFDYTNASVRIVVLPNQTVNTTIYPMIISADDYAINPNPHYQPYALSNAELTAAIQALQAQLANQ